MSNLVAELPAYERIGSAPLQAPKIPAARIGPSFFEIPFDGQDPPK
jgi:hypothetical protein